jgi:hypothetical protein
MFRMLTLRMNGSGEAAAFGSLGRAAFDPPVGPTYFP